MDYRSVARMAINQYFAAQDEDELTVTLNLIDRPDIKRVIEIGSFAGGLGWALSQLPHIQKIITIDVAKRPRYLSDKTTFILGDSGDNKIVLKVDEALNNDSADLLIIDGGHEVAQVHQDWELYHPFVRQGGLVMLHDINEWNHHPEIQAREAWLEISPNYPHVEICTNRWTTPGTGLLWLIGE